MDMIETDVCVVGGGIAALRAAMAARAAGASVLVVSKGKAGKSGCSVISEGILNAPFAPNDSPALFVNDIINASAGVAKRQLAWALAESARDAVLSLEDAGITFEREESGELHLKLSGGHAVARTVRVTPSGPGCGKVIPQALYEQATGMDITLWDGATVVKVLTNEGKVCGAVVYDGSSYRLVSCAAVVLATGGAGRVYLYSTNPTGIMGDGAYLALDAGASLVDMEYVQFFPTVALSSYLLLPFIFTDGAQLLNSEGERFIGRYDPSLMEATTRDKMSQAIFTEAMEGRGVEGGACVSCASVPPDILETKYADEAALFAKHGLDLATDPIPVRPACHFFMGGVDIDAECRTAVPGLYACGECAGGTHGANRLAGNALTETLVFGSRAGSSAAAYAASAERHCPSDEAEAYVGTLPSTGGESLAPRLAALRNIAWEKLGIIRTQESLSSAINDLDWFSAEIGGAEQTADLETFFDFRCAVTVLKAVAVAALDRTESRGAHYRADFPQQSEAWKKAIVIRPGFEIAYDPR